MTRIGRVVSRLRRRVRLQLALRLGLLFGAAGLTVFAATIALTKLLVLPAQAPFWGGLGALLLLSVGLLLALTRRLDDIRLAASLDSASHLHSRIGSALAFARLPDPTPMQRLAIEDALTVLDRAQPRLASPWQWSAFVLGLVALALALAVTGPTLWLLDPRVAPGHAATLTRIAVPPPMQRQTVALREDDKKTLESLSEDLSDETREAIDPTVKDLLAELNELIRAMQEGRITAEEAHARLSALDKALNEWKEQAAQDEAVMSQLEEAAKKLKKPDPSLAETLEALRQQALNEAAEALERLAEKLDKDQLDKKARDKLAKDLEALARELKSERQKERDRLAKERDRLKEKERKEKDRFAQKDRDRLKDIERQLERFDDEGQKLSESERQLERLSDDFDEAAQDLMRRLSEMMGPQAPSPQDGGGPEDVARRDRDQGDQGQGDSQQDQAGKDGDGEPLSDDELRRAAEALKRMARRGAGRQQMRAAGGKVGDLREMLRRAAQQGGQDGDGDGDGDSMRGFERSARGEGDKGGEGEGADGKDGMMPGKGSGKGGDMMLLGGKGQASGKVPGKGMGGQSNDPLSEGEGIGVGHDPNLMGERTELGVKTFEDRVEGRPTDGPSQSRVIMAAAGRGFASRAYAEVHQDYSGVVEDALEKEKIPPGKRTYVRRYFDLIRPR